MLDCPPVEWTYFFLSVQGILILLTIFVTIVAVYKLCDHCCCASNNQDGDLRVIKLLQYLCITAELLCITAVGPGLGSMALWLNDCDPSDFQSKLVFDLSQYCCNYSLYHWSRNWNVY